MRGSAPEVCLSQPVPGFFAASEARTLRTKEFFQPLKPRGELLFLSLCRYVSRFWESKLYLQKP
jgi:hypothetical protein